MEGDQPGATNEPRKPVQRMTGGESMLGTGLLAIWCDVDRSRMDQLDAWHIHEHLPERVAIPGFLRARRYDKVSDAPSSHVTVLTLYETQSVDVLASAAYIDRLDNPTPLTRETVPLMKKMRRSALGLVTTRGRGVGGHLSVCQFTPADSGVSDVRKWMTAVVLPKILKSPAVVAAHVFEPEIAATQAKDATTEGRATDTVAEIPPWLVLVEGIADRGLTESEVTLADEFELQTLAQAAKVERYSLTVTLSGPSPPQG